MKHLYFIFSLLLAIGIIGCKDDDEPGVTKKKIDPNAMVQIRAKEKNSLKSTSAEGMSYQDSVEMIVRYSWQWHVFDESLGRNKKLSVGSYPARDTINFRLRWWGSEILDPYIMEKDTLFRIGYFITDLRNLVLTAPLKEDGTPYQWDEDKPDYNPTIMGNIPYDTLGYIPNSVVLKAREQITEAFNRGDYDRVYELFDSAYVFIPITGERYRELEAKGEN